MIPHELLYSDGLVWFHDHGLGYCNPGVDCLYGQAYLAEYEKRKDDPLSRPLNEARLDLVERHHRGPLIDIGCGSGVFVHARNARGYSTEGFDVNPWMITRLVTNHEFQDPFEGNPPDAVSLWDVLEHLPDPSKLLRRLPIGASLFTSLPIFSGPDHARGSKHYKPGEHLWYFTAAGLVRFFDSEGFELLEKNDDESRIGREGIGSFAFRKVGESILPKLEITEGATCLDSRT